METTNTQTQSNVLLSDEQVRRFITDGYLILNAGGDASLHERIYEKLQWALQKEGNPGNNILPRVPELQQILDSPVIRGALESILGRNYLLHPHRFVHNNEPAEKTDEGVRIGKGSASFVGYHQDDHSPLARPRHHLPRYAMILYYPQDTPNTMGPTQIIPATHLHRAISDEERERGFQASGPAGTCVLVHFDLAHGGSLNIADRSRYMAKFVFARVEEPTEPSWDCREKEWQSPAVTDAPYVSPVVWAHFWNWMSGCPSQQGELPGVETPSSTHLPALLGTLMQNASTENRLVAINQIAALGDKATAAIPALVAAMEGDPFVRENATYALGRIGAEAIPALREDLVRHCETPWNEGAFPLENSAYALAAIGEAAVPALISLLNEESEWVQINALFALGEMGPGAKTSVAALIEKLSHPSHPVVRTALDALGQIGAGQEAALPALRRLLTTHNPDWQTPLYRQWTGQDQVRTNALFALLRLGWNTDEVTCLVAECLNDPCGYVTGLGVEILVRQNTPLSLRYAVESLRAHRWDDTLKKGVRTF